MLNDASKLTKPTQLLAVSFYYPPANNPRAVQVARLLKHLNASTFLVCGGDYRADDRIDSNLSPLAENFLQKCLRVPFSQPAWKRATAKVAYQFDMRLWEKTPDRYRDWKPSVLRAVQESAQQTHIEPEVLVTFGSPMSDHLIGLELQKRYEVPWIAHFSDPWVDNPFKEYNALQRNINLSLERRVIESADRVVFTSNETVDLVMSKYSEKLRSKARVLSHAFEPNLYASRSENSSSRIVVRYVGDLYLQRTPAPLFRALGRILSSDPRLLKEVCFEFVGSATGFRLSEIGYDQLPEGLVVFRPTVDYLTSLSLMSSANGLLVIDAPAATSVFLPSKLVDYIGADRPILGITPPGAASKLIAELGGWVADPSNESDTEKAVRSFISFLRDNSTDLRGSWGEQAIRQQFDAASVARKFEQMIGELIV